MKTAKFKVGERVKHMNIASTVLEVRALPIDSDDIENFLYKIKADDGWTIYVDGSRISSFENCEATENKEKLQQLYNKLSDYVNSKPADSFGSVDIEAVTNSMICLYDVLSEKG